MRNLSITLSLLSLFWLASCQGNSAKEADSTTTEVTVEDGKGEVYVAQYASAAVYAGKTEYQFIGEDGQDFLISDGNEEEKSIKTPDNLLEDPDEIDDLPGANPILIGKKFELHKNAEGKFTEFKLVEGQKIYEKAILAEYVSAAQYPMDMQYYFTNLSDGEDFTIYVSYDEETPSKKMPAELLENPGDLPEDETMVGPNEKVIGWYYIISYEGEQIKEVHAVPGQTYNEG